MCYAEKLRIMSFRYSIFSLFFKEVVIHFYGYLWTMQTLVEHEDGKLRETTREFRTFAKDLDILARWLKEEKVELAGMESTCIYWKKPYNTLEDHGIKTFVVNARHVKQVPGRKTDVKDSQWLASLARFGLLKASFIP